MEYCSIIYIAAFTSVSSELHELIILKCGMMFSTGFEKVLFIYNPSIYETADVISTYVQRMGIVQQQYGFSAAVGLFNSLVNTALIPSIGNGGY